jgi:hypothetical protein
MAVCPLLQKECIRERCMWYMRISGEGMESECVLNSQARLVNAIHGQLAALIMIQQSMGDYRSRE